MYGVDCLQVLGCANLIPHAERGAYATGYRLIRDGDDATARACNPVVGLGEQVEAVSIAGRTAIDNLANMTLGTGDFCSIGEYTIVLTLPLGPSTCRHEPHLLPPAQFAGPRPAPKMSGGNV